MKSFTRVDIRIITCTLIIVICAALIECRCPLSVTEHPQLVVGYTGERVFYECTICGGTLYWEVNGTSLYHFRGEPYHLEEKEGIPGELSLIALPSLNNTIVQCIAFSSGTDVYSNPVPILVQGTLGAPTNLASDQDVNDHDISLSWTPPYTLPTTSMTFEIIVSVAGHPNSLRATTSSPSYTISFSDLSISPDSAHTAKFTVRAVNPAGEGEPASITVTIPAQSNSSSEQDVMYVTIGVTAVIFLLLIVLITIIIIISCYLLKERRRRSEARDCSTGDNKECGNKKCGLPVYAVVVPSRTSVAINSTANQASIQPYTCVQYA